MNTEIQAQPSFEISTRFHQSLQERITRLECDADSDELNLASLTHADHIKRHRRLVAAQRAEALSMRLFLHRSQIRMPRPFIGL